MSGALQTLLSPATSLGWRRSVPPGPSPQAILQVLVRGALLVALGWAAQALARRGWYGSAFDLQGKSYLVPVGVAVLTTAARFLAPDRWRGMALAALAVGLTAWVLEWWSIPLLLLGGVTIGVVRLSLPLGWRLVLLGAAWLVPVLVRIYSLTREVQQDTFFLSVLWAGFAYSILYLVTERHRRPNAPGTVADDLWYLLAPPRIIAPFFQPISPGVLTRGGSGAIGWGQLVSGVGLAAWGLALAAVLAHLPAPRTFSTPTEIGFGFLRAYPAFADLAFALDLGIAFLRTYAIFAHHIFVSIAMFRLMGWDLPSGFHFPFLSTSFADFFRRWNHYVRDAVLSIFFFPLLGWLRTRMSPRLATATAAYGAIFVGSFVMNDLLTPVVVSALPVEQSVTREASPVYLGLLLAYWSAIVLPAVYGPQKNATLSLGRRALATARFLTLYCALWGLAHWLGQTLR